MVTIWMYNRVFMPQGSNDYKIEEDIWLGMVKNKQSFTLTWQNWYSTPIRLPHFTQNFFVMDSSSGGFVVVSTFVSADAPRLIDTILGAALNAFLELSPSRGT